MSTRAVALIDTAIGSLKAARDDLRHDHDLLASDLSSTVATIRELTWTLDTLTAVLVDRYGRLDAVGHDNGADPAAVVARITERLAHVRRCLDSCDGMLADAHNNAARLHNLDR